MATPGTPTKRQSSGLKGDSKCVKLMCISASVNDTAVTYTMTSTGSAKFGWIAMGFGKKMANSPMVIMWSNSDGTVTLSQRIASGEVMPTVQGNPPREATFDQAQTLTSGNTPKYSFTVPVNSDTTQDVIWAFGNSVPSSSAVDARLIQHLDADTFQLDLTKSLPSSSNPSSDPSATQPGPPISTSSVEDNPLPPLEGYQKLIVAHAVLATASFLLLLPLGVLIARYGRTRTGLWFKSHMYIQLLISGPVVLTAIALGISAVQTAGSGHINDDHKRWGIGLFVLYFLQVTIGLVIHYIKPRSPKRPIQNYLHVSLGLVIVGLACYEVHSGFDEEWPNETGREKLGRGVNILWFVWCALLVALYFAGLAFLPTQFRQEKESRREKEPGWEEMDNLTRSKQ